MGDATIREASFPADAEAIRQLFDAYAKWLGIDLYYQDFETELANMPGYYAPPEGALLLLRGGAGQPLGCVAMRGLSDGDCEMKRLYLDGSVRGTGRGLALSQAIIARARAAGYRRMVLDTLDHMGAAMRLFDRLGFKPIRPYYDNPVPGVVYRGLIL